MLSPRDGHYLSSPHFQTAVEHVRAISLVFSSQLWDLHSPWAKQALNRHIPLPGSVYRYPCLGCPAPRWVHPTSVCPYGPVHGPAVPASRAVGIWGSPRPDFVCVCFLQASGLGKLSNHHPLNLSNHYPSTAWFLGPSDLQASLLPCANEYRALSENSICTSLN